MPRGSQPGERRGGRQKGARNKRTAEMLDQVAATGEMPKEYMLRVMRDGTFDYDRRDRMAVAAAPYYHSRLSAIEHAGPNGGAIQILLTSEDKALL